MKKMNIQTKSAHYRSWKSGKVWLFSASAIAVIAGGAASVSSASAATTTTTDPRSSLINLIQSSVSKNLGTTSTTTSTTPAPSTTTSTTTSTTPAPSTTTSTTTSTTPAPSTTTSTTTSTTPAPSTTTSNSTATAPSTKITPSEQWPTTMPAEEGDNVGQQVPVHVVDDGVDKPFNLDDATLYVDPQTNVENHVSTIRMDEVIQDTNSAYDIVGGLVRNDRNGFYEFSIDPDSQTGHVLTYDKNGNLLKTATVSVGGTSMIGGLQTVNAINSALKVAQGLLFIDPVAAGLAIAQLTKQLTDVLLGNPTTAATLKKDQFGRLYFNIQPVTTPSFSPSVNGDQIVTFTEPLTLDFTPAPVTVKVYEKHADGSVTLTSTKQLAYVGVDQDNGLTDMGAYVAAEAGVIRDQYLQANQNYDLYHDLTLSKGDGSMVPFTKQYTPGEWVIGSATQYAANGTMYNGMGGRKSVVLGSSVLQQLAGQPGISGVALAAGYSSFDEMGKAGYTLQRVAEIDANGNPISAPTSSFFGIGTNYKVQETAWKLVAPSIVTEQNATQPQVVEMGRLYFPTGIWSVDAGGVITAEDIRVTGLMMAGEESGYVFSVITDSGYGYTSPGNHTSVPSTSGNNSLVTSPGVSTPSTSTPSTSAPSTGTTTPSTGTNTPSTSTPSTSTGAAVVSSTSPVSVNYSVTLNQTSGLYLGAPLGVTGSKVPTTSLDRYAGRTVTASKEMKVTYSDGHTSTWVLVSLNGMGYWVDKASLKLV